MAKLPSCQTAQALTSLWPRIQSEDRPDALARAHHRRRASAFEWIAVLLAPSWIDVIARRDARIGSTSSCGLACRTTPGGTSSATMRPCAVTATRSAALAPSRTYLLSLFCSSRMPTVRHAPIVATYSNNSQGMSSDGSPVNTRRGCAPFAIRMLRADQRLVQEPHQRRDRLQRVAQLLVEILRRGKRRRLPRGSP